MKSNICISYGATANMISIIMVVFVALVYFLLFKSCLIVMKII